MKLDKQKIFVYSMIILGGLAFFLASLLPSNGYFLA